MKKFDIFIRSPRARKWRGAFSLLALTDKDAARIASDRFCGYWIKVQPSISFL